jgi:lipid II:glycine glycyltransferase (peptidoglycan interpeptide bridge formation enzyme)
MTEASDGVTDCANALFQQPWWLDAVAPGAWDAAVVVRDGQTVGRLPFVRKQRFGLTVLSRPPLTPFLGPWIDAGTGDGQSQMERQHEVLRDLIAALPAHDIFTQSFHRDIEDCLQFHWAGFSESLHYTYVIDDLADHDRIWSGFRKTVRTHIRKAERQVIVRTIDDIESFLPLYRMTYERQGIAQPYSDDLIRRLDAACRARGVRRIFLAEGADGTPHAVSYLVWDDDSAYELMGGSDPALRHSGAISLLSWEAIKFAGQVTRRYDFEGSMVEPIERYFRAFGCRQIQYPHLLRAATARGRLALGLQRLRTTAWRRNGADAASEEQMGERTVVQAARLEPRPTRSDAVAPPEGARDDGVTPCAHALFQQPWWLDAVAPGAWDAAIVTNDGEIVGRLPYVRMRRFGLTILGQPLLTQFLGPWIKPATGKIHTRLEHEYEILRGLIAALPEHDVFLQDFHHSITNCLPFYWQGFAQSVRYTYVIEDLNDLDAIWNGFRKTVRAHIRKAEQEVVVRAIDDVEPFLALHRMTYERQGMALPYSADLIRRLDAACSARGVRRILLAEGPDGTPHAAVYLVWDAESAYSLMSGNDPRQRSSGAISLLRWEAIKFAREVTRRFDFEGSMLEPVERFFRAFGGRQIRFARLARGATLKGQLGLMAYEWSHARKRRARPSVTDDAARLPDSPGAGPARPAPLRPLAVRDFLARSYGRVR